MSPESTLRPDETMPKIAATLGFPLGFFRGDDLDEPKPDAASFRAFSKMTAKECDMALSQGTIALHFTRWLEERFELPQPMLPDLSRNRIQKRQPKRYGAYGGLENLPIRNMIHLLEAKGARVFSLAMNTKHVDAYSMWKSTTPFVFLNTYKSSAHSRFDAAQTSWGILWLHKHAPRRDGKQN